MSRSRPMMQAARGVLALLATAVSTLAFAQSAPVLRAVVPVDQAPESVQDALADLSDGQATVSIEGAAWLQLRFTHVDLGREGTLTIESDRGEMQTLTQAHMDDGDGVSGAFAGSELTVTLDHAGAATIADVVIGLPPSAIGEAPRGDAAGSVRALIPDIERFIPDDVSNPPAGAQERAIGGLDESVNDASIESICGSNDNRTASTHRFVGRVMPVGCTGWIAASGKVLTAGHCMGPAAQRIEFDVPASRADGTTLPSAIEDQYAIDTTSITTRNTRIGDDWAVMQARPNTQTNLTPLAARGGGFTLSNTRDPRTLRITGYGLDGPAPAFGSGRGAVRNADNQTQQTHVGNRTRHDRAQADRAALFYQVDTQGGNSGSPVLADGTEIAIGIHTNGGCNSNGGANAATSFRNGALWEAAVDSVQAALLHPNGKAYFFEGDQYRRYDFDADRFDKLGRIGRDGWRGLWTAGIDAAVMHPNGKAYFFRGDRYQRFDFERDRVDKEGRIGVDGWRGLRSSGVDAAILHPNGKAYFFHDDRYQRFDFESDRVDKTARIAIDGWQGLSKDGLDGAVRHPNGKGYFFSGTNYQRFDYRADRVDKAGRVGVDGWFAVPNP